MRGLFCCRLLGQNVRLNDCQWIHQILSCYSSFIFSSLFLCKFLLVNSSDIEELVHPKFVLTIFPRNPDMSFYKDIECVKADLKMCSIDPLNRDACLGVRHLISHLLPIPVPWTPTAVEK